MSVLPLLSRLEELDINIELAEGQLKIDAPRGKLTPGLIKELKDRKQELIRFLKEHVQTHENYASIESVEKKEFYPLSSAQRRLYILQQMDAEKGIAYNIPSVWQLEGNFNRERLESVFYGLILRHESLRTFFTVVDDEPVQRIHDVVVFKIKYFDLAAEGTGETARIHNSKFIIQNSFSRPFDLSEAPLLRLELHKVGEEKYILLLDMHHIISDVLSMDIFIRDFTGLYTGNGLPALKFQYKDYTQWLGREAEKERIKQQEAYWLKQFEGEVPVLDLPIDFSRPPEQDFEGRTLHFVLDDEDNLALKRLAQREGTTLFMTLLAFFSTFLAKITGQEDMVIGTPIVQRNHANLENIIGLFTNFLPLRLFPASGKTFMQILKGGTEESTRALKNSDYPFEELVKQVEGVRDASRNPIFDVMLTMQNALESDLEIPGLKLKPCEFENRVSKLDLSLQFSESQGNVFYRFEYSTKLFRAETMEAFSRCFKTMVSAILKEPGQKLSDIEILPAAERKHVLIDLNKTGEGYAGDKTIPVLFEEQAARTPDKTAVRSTIELQNIYDQLLPEDVEIEISYEELNEKANQLAHLLKEQGGEPDSVVGLMVEHPLEKVVGIWGILKSGGAYLPIDPTYPGAVIRDILGDSQVRWLVSETALGDCLANTGVPGHCYVVFIDEIDSRYSLSNPACIASMDNLAYIIYTSGTTGKPKGTAVEHKGIVNYARWRVGYFRFTEDDTALQPLTYSFDSFCANFYSTFLSGGELVMVPDNRRLDFAYIAGLIREYRVTNVCFAPGLYNTLLETAGEGDLHSMRLVVLAGEASGPALLRKSREKVPHVRIANEYGPTEGTVAATAHPEIPESTVNIIGTPIANAKIYILNDSFQPVFPGAAGEICIGGTGVSRGYLNRPGLTNKTFLAGAQGEPFFKKVHHDHRGQNIYRTGDLARWLPDGSIEFLGRKDHQVKVRGHRIELGQVEALLMKHDKIKKALVVTGGRAENKYICAYIVPGEAQEFHTAEIKNYLQERLPYYMVPSRILRLEAFPLTHTGKIDRSALPDPGFTAEEEYTAPRGPTEEALARLWAQVLDIDIKTIGIDSSFFDLGGHSLRATMLVSKIEKEMNVKIPLGRFFNSPTIRELSALIDTTLQETDETGAVGFDQGTFAPIRPVEKQEYYPVSSQQKRLYTLRQFTGEGTAYNVFTAHWLKGNVDVQRIGSAFQKLMEKHEAFRTGFRVLEGEPVQEIRDRVDLKPVYKELPDREMAAEYVKECKREFDLSRPPLLRISIVKVTGNEYLMVVDMHHITADGASTAVLIDELAAAYEGEEPTPLRVQYKDYAKWQRALPGEPGFTRQEAYWMKRFAGEIPVLSLPTDFPRPPLQSFQGAMWYSRLSDSAAVSLKQVCKKYDVTLYMMLMACYQVLLAKYSGQEDVIVGSPVANRDHADTEGIVGMFANTLALRGQPARKKEFHHFLAEIKQIALDAYENQGYPFEELLEKVEVKRDVSRNPLFDTMFMLQNIEMEPLKMGDIEITPYNKEPDTAKFDLTLTASEYEQGITYAIEYCTRLFKKETIDKIGMHYRRILEQVLKEPGKKIAEIEMVTEEEKEQLLYDFNDTTVDYPGDKTAHRLFEEQVERNPDSTALIGQSAGEYDGQWAMRHTITYRELNERSNRLARILRNKGVKPGTLTGIIMPRTIEMMTGIIGIMKAGGAYIPIDPALPEERINYIMAESSVHIILTAGDLKERTGGGFEIVEIGDTHLSGGDSHNLDKLEKSTDLVYVIYTSGSTGSPKGVMIKHRSLVNFIIGMTGIIDFNASDSILSLTTISFDIFGLEAILPLTKGAKVVIGPGEMQLNAEEAAQAIDEEGVTILQVTPSRLVMLASNQGSVKSLKNVKYLLVGGEIFPGKLLEKTRELTGNKIYNLYGPTETTIWSSVKDVSAGKTLNIGKPISNTRIYMLDKEEVLQPPGIFGELCISGDGLARGYLNNPELTAEKFDRDFQDDQDEKGPASREHYIEKGKGIDKNPLTSLPLYLSTPLYRTGDLARWLSDGNIEFLGRIDHQVKVRGFRIELGEIETRLLTHEHVKEAVVICREDSGSDKYLCAYIVPARDEIGSNLQEELRLYLLSRLPDYMVPSFFVPLDRMPVTPNGKIDRKALPAPNIKPGSRYEAPRSEQEKRLVEIWQNVLGVEPVGIGDNFFQLGGHSLKAVKIVSLFEKEGIRMNVADLFRYGNIKTLVEMKPMSHEAPPRNETVRHTTAKDEPVPVEEQENIVAKLDESIREFKAAIRGTKVIKRYPLSAIQKSYLRLSHRPSGRIVGLHGYPDQERLCRSLVKLTAEQGLLRSLVKKEGNDLYWYEHEMPANPRVPLADLSNYGHGAAEEIARAIAARYFPDPAIDIEILPYTMILVKKNPGDYLLVFSADHIIFDVLSGQILEAKIDNFYHGRTAPGSGGIPGNTGYEEYINQVARGPQEVSEEKIIETFELEEFRDSMARVNRVFESNRTNRFVNHEIIIPFKDPDGHFDERMPLQISLHTYALLCKAFFNIEKVPLLFFSFGRKYRDREFFDTLGLFIDLVPILVSPGKNISATIEEKIAFAAEHNINFMATLMSAEKRAKWKKMTGLLAPDGVGYDHSLLRFNFLGKSGDIPRVRPAGSGKSIEIKEQSTGDTQLDGVTVMASYNNECLKIEVGFNMEADMAEFRKRIQAAAHRMADVY